MYTWVLLRVRARLTRHWKNAFFFHNKKGDWSCIIHFVSIFLCKVFETSLTWLSYHLFILQGAVLCTPPTNGALVCNYIGSDQTCQVQCKQGYDFEFTPPLLYYCSGGNWNMFSIGFYDSRLPWQNCTSKCDEFLVSPYLLLWTLGLYICARGFRGAYNGGAYVLWGF